VEAALRQQDEVLALGQRLFADRRGPLPLYPHSLYNFAQDPRISVSDRDADPEAPPRLLLRLEATAAGCQWLLDRWAELGALLDRGACWQSHDKLKAIRLLGHQPLDAADSDLVATIFLACDVLDPQAEFPEEEPQTPKETICRAQKALRRDQYASSAEWREARAEEEAAAIEEEEAAEAAEEAAETRRAWQSCGAGFTELAGELTEEERAQYRRRLEGRQVDRLRPADPAAARAALRAIVEKARIRLEAKREVHQSHAALEAAEAADRLGFDASAFGEQLRRYQLAGQRALLRTVDSLLKLRRSVPPGPAGEDFSATIACGLDGIPSSFTADRLAVACDPTAAAEPAPALAPVLENPSNEPTAAGADPPGMPAGSPSALDPPAISPNEPEPEPEPDPAPRVPHPGPEARTDSPPPGSTTTLGKPTGVGTQPAARKAAGAASSGFPQSARPFPQTPDGQEIPQPWPASTRVAAIPPAPRRRRKPRPRP
jgi:hypothetical protein